ncbi:DNA-directed RNA polymerase III subunit RPC3-like isoform X3 [Gordionus sp. m RMFG-2023]
MTNIKCDLVKFVIEEHFGEVCAEIIHFIIKYGPSIISSIINHLNRNYNLRACETKLYIGHLINHNLVNYNEKDVRVYYDVNVQSIFYLIRFSKYVYITRQNFGKIAETIIINILNLGRTDIVNLLATTYLKLKSKHDYFEIKDQLLKLISHKLIRRIAWLENEINLKDFQLTPKLVYIEKFAYNIPKDFDFNNEIQNLKKLERSILDTNPTAKRLKLSHIYQTNKVYWMMNYEKLDSILVEQLISQALKIRYIEPYCNFCQLDISTNNYLNNVSQKIFNNLKNDYKDNGFLVFSLEDLISSKIEDSLKDKYKNAIKQLLEYLATDSEYLNHGKIKEKEKIGWIYKLTDSSYKFYMDKSIHDIYAEFIFYFIKNKYGSKAARIYNLIKHKKACEQKKIEELAMMPPKEVKENVYTILNTGLINIQEVSKGTDFAPSRTFYLFKAASDNDSLQIMSNYCYK